MTSFRPTIVTITPSDTANVVMLVSGIAFTVSTSLVRRPTRRRRHADQAGQLPDRDLDADAGEESDEHGPRQEVGDEPELDRAGR